MAGVTLIIAGMAHLVCKPIQQTGYEATLKRDPVRAPTANKNINAISRGWVYSESLEDTHIVARCITGTVEGLSGGPVRGLDDVIFTFPGPLVHQDNRPGH